MKLLCGTNYVNTEERCLSLRETERVRPDSRGINRYMVITVLRDAGPMEFVMDMGPAKQFKDAEQFHIVTGGNDPASGYFSEHSVGEALDMANHLREGPYERPEPPPVSDLIGAYFDQEDRKRKARQSLSTFGYGQALQRS